MNHRLVIGELPKPMLRVKRAARSYRRDLESACQDRHGEISVVHAHIIDAAVGNETHAAICRWLLNQKLNDMTPADIITCSRNIAQAKATRNRAVFELDLDTGRDDPWATLDNVVTNGDDQYTDVDHSSGATTGDDTEDEDGC